MPTTATLRPGRPIWRSGDDGRQHAIADVKPVRGACGAQVRDERFHRPDMPRCLSCVEVVGIDVAPGPIESESERRFAWGDR